MMGRNGGDRNPAPFGTPLSALANTGSFRDVRRRWNIARDDLEAKAIIDQLDDVWRSWTNIQRLILLDAAEAVAQAQITRTAHAQRIDGRLWQ